MDSFLLFPYISTVPGKTEAFLTAEFEMGSGEPGSYDRPVMCVLRPFIKLLVNSALSRKSLAPINEA